MSPFKPSIAIAGLTGVLGPSLLKAYSEAAGGINLPIHALTRKAPGPNTDVIHYHAVDYASPSDLEAALNGVDVLVDVLNGPNIDIVHKALIDACVATGVRVVFPSKFGADYRIDTIYKHPSFVMNNEVGEYADARIPKVVRVFHGMFIDWLQFYKTSEQIVEVVGTGDEKISATSSIDVARTIVQLSLLLNPPTEPDKGTAGIPTYVYVSGSTATFNEGAKLTGKELKLISISDARAKYEKMIVEEGGKHSTVRTPSYGFMLKCFMAEGWFDYSKNNHNELVNPRGSRWKWDRWQDFASQTAGNQ